MPRSLAHSTRSMLNDFLVDDWLLKQAPPDAINTLTLSHVPPPSSKLEFTRHSFLSASDAVASAIFRLLRDVGEKKAQTSAKWTCVKSYGQTLPRPRGPDQPCVYLPLTPWKLHKEVFKLSSGQKVVTPTVISDFCRRFFLFLCCPHSNFSVAWLLQV